MLRLAELQKYRAVSGRNAFKFQVLCFMSALLLNRIILRACVALFKTNFEFSVLDSVKGKHAYDLVVSVSARTSGRPGNCGSTEVLKAGFVLPQKQNCQVQETSNLQA